jgi:hypothetical protein
VKRTITVLQDDIDKGCVRATNNCPIARAAIRDLADLLMEGCDVGVGCSHITLWDSRTWPTAHYQAELPLSARIFVVAFDDYQPVEPFKFEIEIG